jgi:hypothetical protein
MRALLEAARPEIDTQIGAAVRDAVDDALGIPRISPDDAAERRREAVDGILESVGEFHARDLTTGEQDLFARLQEHLPSIDDGTLLAVATDAMDADRRSHRLARTRLAEALPDAVALPPEAREREVGCLLDAERERLKRRHAGRLPRAVDLLKAQVRLSDEALDVPLGGHGA